MSRHKSTTDEKMDALLERAHRSEQLTAILRSLVATVLGMHHEKPSWHEGDEGDGDWYGPFEGTMDEDSGWGHLIQWGDITQQVDLAKKLVDGYVMRDEFIFTPNEKNCSKMIAELAPLIVSDTGVLLKPDLIKRLSLRLAEINREPDYVRAIRYAKKAIVQHEDDDPEISTYNALRGLMSTLGYDEPDCSCEDVDEDGHNDDCQVEAWRHA